MTLAFLFPGQGSQSKGMLLELAQSHSTIRSTFEEASDVLGYSVWKLIEDDERLNETEFTQPALLASSIALYRLWREQGGPKPALAAGHSLGEYSALCAAGALEFSDALKLVQARGRFMQSAIAEGVGAMAAILGCDNQEVDALCRQVGSEGMMLSAANYTAEGQVVVAGHVQAIVLLHQLSQSKGFKVMPLPVSVPSHCVLMTPASKQLQQYFKEIEFKAPEFKILHNVDVATHDNDHDIKQALINQVSSPVLWSDTMAALNELGADKYVECGPGKVLAGLGKRQSKRVQVASLHTQTDFEAALAALS